MNAALRYRAQAPLLDSLLQELGIDGGDINGLSRPLREAGIVPSDAEPTAG